MRLHSLNLRYPQHSVDHGKGLWLEATGRCRFVVCLFHRRRKRHMCLVFFHHWLQKHSYNHCLSWSRITLGWDSYSATDLFPCPSENMPVPDLLSPLSQLISRFVCFTKFHQLYSITERLVPGLIVYNKVRNCNSGGPTIYNLRLYYNHNLI